MLHNEAQMTEVQLKFSARRRNQLILAIPLIAIIVLFALLDNEEAVLGIPIKIIGPASFVVILGGLAFSFYNWRCPGCNKYLGKNINPKFCSKCGVELS